MRAISIAAALLALATSAAAAPAVHVRIACALDAAEHAAHVALVRRALRELPAARLDVALTRLAVAATGEVTARVEVVVSAAGRIHAVASADARFVATPHRLRDPAALRREVLAHALAALERRVRATTTAAPRTPRRRPGRTPSAMR